MSRTRRGQQAGNRIDPRTARGGHLLNIYLAIYLSLLFKRHSGSIDGLDDCMAAELDNPLQNLTLPSALVFELKSHVHYHTPFKLSIFINEISGMDLACTLLCQRGQQAGDRSKKKKQRRRS